MFNANLIFMALALKFLLITSFWLKLFWIFPLVPVPANEIYPGEFGVVRVSSDSGRKSRNQILKNMEKVMGKLPQRNSLVPLDILIIDSVKEEQFTRYNLSFSVAKDERLSAYLYVPFQSGNAKKLAAMLILHETDPLGKGSVDGQSGKPNRAYARELAQRGYVVLLRTIQVLET